jgi:hypothetical protein
LLYDADHFYGISSQRYVLYRRIDNFSLFDSSIRKDNFSIPKGNET